MKHLIFLVFVRISLALDYSEEAKKYYDPGVDPCDNFYRHVCRLGGPPFLPAHFGSMMMSENQKRAEQNPKIYSEFEELENDIQDQSSPRHFSELVASVYKTICESKQDTLPFLSELEKMFTKGDECQYRSCMTHLANDPDCNRVSQHLQSMFDGSDIMDSIDVKRMHNKSLKLARKMDSSWTNNQLSREGEFQNNFQEMKNVAIELIMETPWVKNHNASKMIVSLLDKIYTRNLWETTTEALLKYLKKTKTVYSDCKRRYANVSSDAIQQYCLFFATITMKESPLFQRKLSDRALKEAFLTAQTGYPWIEVGYVWYQMFYTTENRVAKIASPGWVIAHEMSHALIKSVNGDLLTYFSEEAKQCIQEQYQSSCKYFDEGNCAINDMHFEENGADAFAVEIVWKLFENSYLKGEANFDEMESTEDLRQFFYSLASNLCDGEMQVSDGTDDHSPTNIRINAFVNHPAFQKAFQCSDDSRMMQSKTKQCSVYGPRAPITRRRFSLFHRNILS